MQVNVDICPFFNNYKMKPDTNKTLEDSWTFMIVATIVFAISSEPAFPLVAFMIRVLMIIFASLIMILGVGSLVNYIFSKRKNNPDEN